ncbi:DUF5337 domain-containing protein [Hasllibacter halocynthiae]|nr:DUF5337 domain-containing protein [Hasllibacter halocynthiae]
MAESRQVRRARARRAGAPSTGQGPPPSVRREYGPERLALARQARSAALVMAGTMVIWFGLNMLGREMGMPGGYALVFDLAAVAAFIWALAVVWRVWRKGRELDQEGR